MARTTRNQENREFDLRPASWKPADLLPAPEKQEGWEFKYIRKDVLGTTDPTNMSKARREGWEPCRLEDHPELMLAVDKEASNSGLIEIGGLVLCKMPEEMWKSRDEYYASMSGRQMESVDAQLDRVNDPRMPLFRERQTKVFFGSGSGR